MSIPDIKERIDPLTIEKVLIARTDRIGDVVLTLPLLAEAKKLFKNAAVSMLVSINMRKLLNKYEDADNIFFVEDMPRFNNKLAFFKQEKFDTVINAYPRRGISVAAYSAGVKYRVGTAYRWYSFLYNVQIHEHRKDCLKHESEYNLNLLCPFTDEITDEKRFNFKYNGSEETALLLKAQDYGLGKDDKYLIIHPGSGGSAKDWPAKNFAELIIRIMDNFPAYKIALTGTVNERNLINEIRRELARPAPQLIQLTGELNLKELLILIDRSKLFISNSTGPIHIAGALNKNIIGLYPSVKPMDPTRWKPLSTNAVILTGDIKDSHLLIDTDKVFAETSKILSEN